MSESNRTRIGFILVMALIVLSAYALFRAEPGSAAQNDSSCKPAHLNTSEWATDFCNHSVDYDEIVDVIVPRSRVGIAAVDAPALESIEDAREWLGERSPVIAVEIDGEARAYPLAILTYHEIVNDVVNDTPIAVTYCPLCNSAIVFDSRVDDQTLTFRVSGKLRNSDLIMWDLETETWWQQFTGIGIVGEHNEVLLDIVPSQVVGFGHFAERYPDGRVMSRDTGYSRAYGSNPYSGYDEGGPYGTFFDYDKLDSRVYSMENVLAGEVNGQPIAYTFASLTRFTVINDTVAGEDVVAVWQPGTATAMGAAVIDSARDIGTAALFKRTVGDLVLTFAVNENGFIVDEQTKSIWNVWGEAVQGELTGTALEQIVAAPHFWFAWAAFHPDTLVYGIDTDE